MTWNVIPHKGEVVFAFNEPVRVAIFTPEQARELIKALESAVAALVDEPR